MENVGFVPVCKSMQKSRRNTTYHRLKSIKEVRECSQSSNVGKVFSPNMKMVEDKPKAQPKIRLSTNLLKRFRDAYVEAKYVMQDMSLKYAPAPITLIQMTCKEKGSTTHE
ncbi:unnamed protein product [Lupinus luteus]|uniref:Uncharacterized protein n=1 Tax=Lupinus luteus TaxID=3873 RepID=A0AAV1XQ66_LUPLU